MRYEPGDLVYPVDLPRRVLCRVIARRSITTRGCVSQILRLEPIEGQSWHPAVTLVRRVDLVLPVRLGDLWRAGGPLAHRGSRMRRGGALERAPLVPARGA